MRLCLLVLSSALLLFAAAPRRILVHGHRGARARRPENTLPAFDYALRHGVDALEMDMAVTSDNYIVISHDPVLQAPVCHGPQQRGVIHELTLSQVRQWDCGFVGNPQFPLQVTAPGAPVPTLDEVFDLAGRGTFDYNIETKSFPDHPEYTPEPEEFAKLVLEEIRAHKLEKRIILQSFDFRTLAAMRKLAPEIRLSALTDNDQRSFAAISKDAANAEIVSPSLSLVTAKKVAAAHAAGIQVVPWTADTPAEWNKLIAAKVDAIITDDPAPLLAYLKRRGR
jgi:glycerophosphoryl diester phosphodiesterase